MHHSAYNIFTASAGSGKTFTLVKEYLKVILSSENNQQFRHILAITFTNKAVNEMKQRILQSLSEISRCAVEEEESDMARILSEELNLDRERLRLNAQDQLRKILHNYAYFDVSTIDKFTHRIIRTFAKDLKLSHNFEVLLDTDLLLDEGVENLLSHAGQDKLLTKSLTDFALEKTDSDKYWDLHNDLFKAAKLIFQENDLPHVKRLASKSIKDFVDLQKKLRSEIGKIQENTATIADKTLKIIEESGLSEDDFPSKTLPNHFRRISRLDWNTRTLYGNKLEDKLQSGKILKSGLELPNEELPQWILTNYREIKSLVFRWALLQNIYQNILPLTMLNAIYAEIKEIEAERDLLPISSFNNIISETIADQPAPFIYERLGEKYRHFFIDEFQDTSEMQWNNLIPLISNALESVDPDGKTGSILLVGDVKQAIYRWRGGKSEQFLALINLETNPFVVQPHIQTLDLNYRSASEIIRFNNAFFKSSSSFVGKEIYHKLFAEETQQKLNTQRGGLVQIEFVEHPENDLEQVYFNRVKQAINAAVEKGYQYSEISILTRKKKHGIIISQNLIESGIPVVSSETLLLHSSPEVNFLIDLLELTHRPADQELAFNVVDYLIPQDSRFHLTMEKALENPEQWLEEQWGFSLQSFHFQALYDGLEEAIRIFNLVPESDAFITYFLDEVLKLEQRQESGIPALLDFWEKNKEKLSITAPENLNAVKVMTIHKAKGLEFPVVIFPFANSKIYDEVEPKLWFDVNPDEFSGFSELLISKRQQITNYSEQFSDRFVEEQHKLELDAFNILYVALTRAVEALFIISDKDLDTKGLHKTNVYSGLFIHYLTEIGIWSIDQNRYSFGALKEQSRSEDSGPVQESIPYILSNKHRTAPRMVIKNATLWDDQRIMALERGTLIHYIMSQIRIKSDFDHIVARTRAEGLISEREAKAIFLMISKIINHPDLKSYYMEGRVVKNEQEIIGKNGLILRPDRLIIDNNDVTVIDYKTGMPKPEDRKQILEYGDALREMGYSVQKRIIVYIDQDIKVEFIQ